MLSRLAFLAALLASASPAMACSVVKGYRIPTNFQLIQQADLVVLARVGKMMGKPDPIRDNPNLKLEPIRAIKGELPAEPLLVELGPMGERWSRSRRL